MLVYKYRSAGIDSEEIKYIFERDIKSLVNDEFFAPTRDSLNDPYEGFISIKIFKSQIQKIVNKNPHISENMKIVEKKLNVVLNHKDSSGIYSLSKNNLDELLWAHYANSHKGFCIEYDLDILLKLNKEMAFPNNELSVFDIRYQKRPYNLTIKDMNNLKDVANFMSRILGYKSIKWKYENEIRIICAKSGTVKYDYRAVKSIYFGLKMQKEQENEIMKKLQGRGIKYYKIKLKDNTYNLYPEPVKDLYETEKKYLYSIAPIQEYAISNISDKYKEYYFKVAEIVRREPYCDSLEIIIIDKEKSKLNNPTFLVQFLWKKSIKINQYYSIKEIDKLYNLINDLKDESMTK